jgi:hypothetical protein
MDISEVLDIIGRAKTTRDHQVEVGPSEIGGCRRKVWHRLQRTPATNATLGLAAWMGTAIHKAIERAFDVADPFSERYLREVEVSSGGLMGHVDLYDIKARTVTDWKTTTKKNLRYFPSQQQRTQIHLYGYLLSQNGYPVETVQLIAIVRDGNETDVKQHSEPYDEELALGGIAWLAAVEASQSPPEPEKRVSFCRDYCEFWSLTDDDGCRGMS